MKTTLRIVASLVLACSALVVSEPSAAQTTRTLTVTPDTDLVDGDVVTLHGSGFTPSANVFFCQAVDDGTPGQDDCGVSFSSTVVDAAGEFTATYTVRRFMSPPSAGTTIDCAQPSANCVIGASDSQFPSPGTVAFAPIAFTPLPPLTVTATPDTGLVDGDIVTLHGTGFTPLEGALFIQASPGSPGFQSPTESVQADGAGEFSVNYTVHRFLSSGTTTLDCASPSAGCAMRFFGGFPDISVPLAFAPQPPVPGQVFGTVTDSTGAPLPGIEVWAYTSSDAWVGSLQTVTDAQGSYAFAQVETGVQYRIRFRYPAGSSLAAEWFDNRPSRQVATSITITRSTGEFVEANAQLEEAGAISGSVTDTNGNPVSGVPVWAYGPTDTIWVGSRVTSTASDGTYRIDNVRPDGYRVRFAPPTASGLAVEWFDDAAGRAQATVVTVSSGQTVTGINAQLANSP